jgi:hypothetical protein
MEGRKINGQILNRQAINFSSEGVELFQVTDGD